MVGGTPAVAQSCIWLKLIFAVSGAEANDGGPLWANVKQPGGDE